MQSECLFDREWKREISEAMWHWNPSLRRHGRVRAARRPDWVLVAALSMRLYDFRVLKTFTGMAVIVLAGLATPAHAVSLAVSSGAFHMPNSSYHQLVFDGQLSFSVAPSANVVWQLGAAPPFAAHGFTQQLFYSSLQVQWSTERTGARLFGGAGFGVYGEKVNNSFGLLPSIALTGGARVGSETLGLQLSMNTQLGISNFASLISSSVAWPAVSFLGGIYVAL